MWSPSWKCLYYMTWNRFPGLLLTDPIVVSWLEENLDANLRRLGSRLASEHEETLLWCLWWSAICVKEHTCWGKKHREDSESFKCRKNKVFYVIFSVLMYFLWEISTWDAFLARDSGSPSLSFWPCYVLKIREFGAFSGMLLYVSSPAITLSAFAKACTPN